MPNVNVTVGHTVTMGIQFVDTAGNPMLTQPAPDAPPTWADVQAPSGVATFTSSADGLSAIDVAVAAGSDAVTCSLAVGGVTFTANLAVTISAAPQVLGGFVITSTVA